jgi:hypothetical protein
MMEFLIFVAVAFSLPTPTDWPIGPSPRDCSTSR